MRFTPTPLPGAFLIEPAPRADARGAFTRTWCRREFEAAGLDPALAQCSASFNHLAGTLRGMHFNAPPFEEAKLVRCTRGAIHDVIIDLRPDSPTRARWFAATLTADDYRMLYVPRGFAHGFLTLEDRSEVLYHISDFHAPQAARGVRWNDPAFGIVWPREVAIIHERDASYPDYAPVARAARP